MVYDKSHKYEQDKDGFVYPIADDRYSFSVDQLSNIGIMLLRMIEDNPDIAGLPIPKIDMDIPLPRVTGNRIILAGRVDYGIYTRGIKSLSLSLAPNGSVNYFLEQTDKVTPENNTSPIYKELKINFQSINK